MFERKKMRSKRWNIINSSNHEVKDTEKEILRIIKNLD